MTDIFRFYKKIENDFNLDLKFRHKYSSTIVKRFGTKILKSKKSWLEITDTKKIFLNNSQFGKFNVQNIHSPRNDKPVVTLNTNDGDYFNEYNYQ